VSISNATLHEIYRFASGQLLLTQYVLIILSYLSQIFPGISDAYQQVERLKTQQWDPYQLGGPLRLWASQSLNLPIYRGIIAVRIMMGLLQPDPLQSAMMEQLSSSFAFIILLKSDYFYSFQI
jgi:hypothetical protein